jgi:hypothetical protein
MNKSKPSDQFRLDQLEARLAAIEQRNRRVEVDKAWEGSTTRKLTIIVLTYFVVLCFLVIIHNDRPFINAIMPSLGFFLSTLAITDLKKHWINRRRA